MIGLATGRCNLEEPHSVICATRPGDEPYPYPLVWLPPVCTIAFFESAAPARDPLQLYSALVVIWFQEGYGMTDDARVLEQLRNVDWARQAHDETP